MHNVVESCPHALQPSSICTYISVSRLPAVGGLDRRITTNTIQGADIQQLSLYPKCLKLDQQKLSDGCMHLERCESDLLKNSGEGYNYSLSNL